MAQWKAMDKDDRGGFDEPTWSEEDKGVAHSCMYYLDHVALSWYAMRSVSFGVLSR